MRGDPISDTLINPSAKQIRDRKIELWRNWQDTNDMPAEIIVRRGYDLLAQGRSVMIIVRSLIPRHMTWND